MGRDKGGKGAKGGNGGKDGGQSGGRGRGRGRGGRGGPPAGQQPGEANGGGRIFLILSKDERVAIEGLQASGALDVAAGKDATGATAAGSAAESKGAVAPLPEPTAVATPSGVGKALQLAFEEQQRGGPWLKMKPMRDGLPVAATRAELLDGIAKHDVTIISGGTGCGKSTQIPQ